MNYPYFEYNLRASSLALYSSVFNGNGRVERPVSYSMLRNALETQGLWSIARGLDRRETAYKAHLKACDGPSRGDRDGRGALSEQALAAFAEFFWKSVSIKSIS